MVMGQRTNNFSQKIPNEISHASIPCPNGRPTTLEKNRPFHLLEVLEHVLKFTCMTVAIYRDRNYKPRLRPIISLFPYRNF